MKLVMLPDPNRYSTNGNNCDVLGPMLGLQKMGERAPPQETGLSACFWLHLPCNELTQVFTNVNGNFSRCF